MTEHNAEHREISIEAYHRHPAIGCSMLKAFGEHPKLYDCRHVTKDGAPFKGTPSTDFGSMVDAWLLERETCIEIPASVLSKSGSKAGGAWKEWKADNAGLIQMKPSDVDICERIQANIAEHADACKLCDNGESQYSVFWTDQATGLDCKCRYDFVRGPKTLAVLIDLKTTKSTNAEDFAWQSLRLHYDWQCAHYRRGWYELTGDWRPFFFVVVKNTEPYDVAVFKLDDEWVAEAEIEVANTLKKIAASNKSGLWLPPGYGGTLEIQRPKRAEYKKAWEIEENEQ